ncbi:GNAT family N-acetyltransferase [Chitinophaga pendula]|uniref:GNAT family N-acetyltransferase n=1 Tax=Chitinophaga TaxID=79328 RepID=UPI000BAFA44A|nr:MULTISPECIES: GNAT family N-acetyltransferase [Chitinophaga]ASZ12190.1 GNAT family N-acetyltransferase [Chitinophaga sp. MD30]UCJ04783.1 GNAT family N-acetyltransferase [Chitinophaga pendula]
MTFDIQPVLENEIIALYPLEEDDFEALYTVAADPKVWEQHPNKDRWKREVFQVFFEGAIKSKGAFKIIDKLTGEVAGSTRFYDYNSSDNSILIGYTFYATRYWGKGINPTVKKLMLDYIFQFVSTAIFQVGADNIRSQIAVGRLGARKIAEQEMTYYGEPPKFNFVYALSKDEWQNRQL